MLTQIEVFNFKSYRGHQTIGPFSTFTSVIGPNGAGKSNLMDAISFVLGVKSSQLRSGQLRDLIYRGRKLGNEDGEQDEDGEGGEEEEGGEGDAQKAWVAAVYEDGKGKSFRFQRTISLAGSSEYRINSKVVTYQAYNATLEQQQILVKARNFLVFQGDVEAVASQSPKELSRLIDQISGSLEYAGEYERCKAAQERATENATFNYTKRRGIATEIKQFKEQKTEAERFERLCRERDELIVHRLLWKLFHIEETIEKNTEQIKAKNAELDTLRADQERHDKAYEKARKEEAQARKKTMGADKEIKKAEKALEEKKPNIIALEEKIKHAERAAKKAKEMGEATSRDAGKQEEAVKRLTGELGEVRKAERKAAEAARAAAQKGLAFGEESLAEYTKLKADASTHAVEERQQRETLQREEKTKKRALDALADKVEQAQAQKEKLLNQGAVVAERKQTAEKKVKELEEDLKETKQNLDNIMAERQRIDLKERELHEKIRDCSDKLLEADVDQRESEREVRLKDTLESLQKMFKGVRGRVIDLCKPTARKYETALAIVFGKDIDSIVVDEEKIGIQCIDFLKTSRIGQATFLPLDTLQVKPINEKYRTIAKGARLAFDIIQFDPSVTNAMQHACGNALVCDTTEIARHICYEKGEEVKAVTLEGNIIHKNGLITGGTGSHSRDRKWSDSDVAGLRKTLEDLTMQLNEVTQSRPRHVLDENLRAAIGKTESELTVARDELKEAALKLQGIQDEAKHVTRELKKLEPELEKARKALADLQTEIEKFSHVINAAEDKIFAGFCRKYKIKSVREYEEGQLKVSQEESEAKVRFSTQIARLTAQLEFETANLEQAKTRLERLNKAGAENTAALKKHQEAKEAAEEEMQQDEEALAGLRATRDELAEVQEQEQKKLDEAKRAANKAAKVLDKALKEISNMNDEIDKLASERATIYRRSKVEEIELPLKSGSLDDVPMEETIMDEMGIDADTTQRPHEAQDFGIEVDFENLDDDDRENGSPEALAELDAGVAKITAEIEKMAPNMKAMDRLDDVEQKLVETEKEADKARKESKTAREEFNEVKKQRCDLFNKAYNHISECIDQVYKDLTKGKAAPEGGFAYLSLEDSEEPYLGGVKYHAMPPMKRFRDMELLSGGEKTVAALALLFAIHSYQPSPFFVLDEVDAALDNTNVAKIATYLREHASEGFQFIVISLKGSLYERGNSLVGIYRDQDGNSSKTLTLDLTQYAG